MGALEDTWVGLQFINYGDKVLYTRGFPEGQKIGTVKGIFVVSTGEVGDQIYSPVCITDIKQEKYCLKFEEDNDLFWTRVLRKIL